MTTVMIVPESRKWHSVSSLSLAGSKSIWCLTFSSHLVFVYHRLTYTDTYAGRQTDFQLFMEGTQNFFLCRLISAGQLLDFACGWKEGLGKCPIAITQKSLLNSKWFGVEKQSRKNWVWKLWPKVEGGERKGFTIRLDWIIEFDFGWWMEGQFGFVSLLL